MEKPGKPSATSLRVEKAMLSSVPAGQMALRGENAELAMDVKSLIHTIRGIQVLLDRDLARLYGVETGVLNRQVKRNAERFPADFMFRLTKEETLDLKCQIGISSWGGDRQLPHAFTEQGVAMLSGVLRSAEAVEVNIRIMRAFVEMRRFFQENERMLHRVEVVERRQIADSVRHAEDQRRNEERFNAIFGAMRDEQFHPQKVFCDGQVWDARLFAEKLLSGARKTILLIDNWVDAATLELLASKRRGVVVELVTSGKGNRLSPGDIAAFNAQYGGLAVRTSGNFHDRFLAIDDKTLYLVGASLKDLGRKCFAFAELSPSEIPLLRARI